MGRFRFHYYTDVISTITSMANVIHTFSDEHQLSRKKFFFFLFSISSSVTRQVGAIDLFMLLIARRIAEKCHYVVSNRAIRT